MQSDITPLDHGKAGAETCRGENELEIKVKYILILPVSWFCFAILPRRLFQTSTAHWDLHSSWRFSLEFTFFFRLTFICVYALRS
jgi:hypothetical protein